MKLVLFDIDGTLLNPDGAGSTAMMTTLGSFYGVPGEPPGYSMAGKLDRQIVLELLENAGLDPVDGRARLDEYWRLYLDELVRVIPTRNIRALPGVPELLAALREREDVVVGLLTGNYEAAALAKLQAVGIDPAPFQVRVFGHEAERRDELPPVAVERAHQALGQLFRDRDIVIIGDTPSDVTCGQALNVRTIGVATGRYSEQELLAAGADFVFADLSLTQQVVDAIVSA